MRKIGKRVRVAGMAAAVAGAVLTAVPGQAAAAECGGWQVDTVARGLEQVENLEPDGEGGFYLAGDTKVYRMGAAGEVRTVLDHLAAPGGLQRDGNDLYFLTRQDGKLQRLDITSGRLDQPIDFAGNGLLRLPGGDFLTTWVGTEGGPPRGLTRYWHDTGAVQPNWSPVPHGEGLALSPDHRTVYTDDLFTGQIYRVPLDDPGSWSIVTTLPGFFPSPDDLTMSRAGDLYVAAHFTGTIYRVDPESGASCPVATGLSGGWTGPSSVRIGPDGDGWALYATLFDGTVRRIRPPAGADLAPA
ncbi:sugar lactone lactonase YvrE [Nocardia transvalensis]|uniref:Sugar lactone lactonase YvrE n=1 Tax=Nocardia transvalensis TaxID=37333 RepID=A0A7W9PMF1_9NOCA|nr:SMP-30/gluconolactonase/LRE family protein [Nocardia transvalensis]MBB5918864.1 sugar lactone lactonase YvrE [Nocardia transvalensis]